MAVVWSWCSYGVRQWCGVVVDVGLWYGVAVVWLWCGVAVVWLWMWCGVAVVWLTCPHLGGWNSWSPAYWRTQASGQFHSPVAAPASANLSTQSPSLLTVTKSVKTVTNSVNTVHQTCQHDNSHQICQHRPPNLSTQSTKPVNSHRICQHSHQHMFWRG